MEKLRIVCQSVLRSAGCAATQRSRGREKKGRKKETRVQDLLFIRRPYFGAKVNASSRFADVRWRTAGACTWGKEDLSIDRK